MGLQMNGVELEITSNMQNVCDNMVIDCDKLAKHCKSVATPSTNSDVVTAQ